MMQRRGSSSVPFYGVYRLRIIIGQVVVVNRIKYTHDTRDLNPPRAGNKPAGAVQRIERQRCTAEKLEQIYNCKSIQGLFKNNSKQISPG